MKTRMQWWSILLATVCGVLTASACGIPQSEGGRVPVAQTPSNFDRWWKPELEATVAAPESHKILFENEEVRVLEVTVQPGKSERLHVHRYPSVIYIDSSPHLIEHLQDGTSRDLGVRPKGAYWLPIAQGHYMENVDIIALHAIRFELKKSR